MRLGKVRHESKYLTIRHFHTKKKWSIEWMCRHLGISRAAYYKWLHRAVPDGELENIKLAGLIREYDERFHHILGYRRMTSWINHFNHTQYSKNRVHRLMKKLGIHSVIRKKKKKYAHAKSDEAAENILQRDFYASAPTPKWATDVTEFKVPGEKKKLYLSAIIDLYDRYPVAYAVSSRNDNRLVFKTFDKAVAAFPDAKPIFHSDRGFQYTSRVLVTFISKDVQCPVNVMEAVRRLFQEFQRSLEGRTFAGRLQNSCVNQVGKDSIDIISEFILHF